MQRLIYTHYVDNRISGISKDFDILKQIQFKIAQKVQMSDKHDALLRETMQICNMCMATGIHKNVYDGETKLLSHMPVSLYPYQLSQTTYQTLSKAHLIWVKLILKVSKDKEFVNQVFKKTADSDPFVNKFLQLYNKYIDQEDYGVACIRVDYMGDQQPELVEFNLMSVGLNGMSDAVQRLAQLYQNHKQAKSEVFYPISNNQATLLDAVQVTLKEEGIKGIALMVVHEKHQKQFNFGDQNAFELEALRRHLKVKRVTMSQFIANYKINEKNQLLVFEEKVALVYFRTAYSPAHYPTEDHWLLRENIEKANVLSIPSVSMQLINFKRMQVQFSKLQVLKKYLDEDEALLLKQLAGELYDFQNQSDLPKLQQLAKTQNYVLKSNREGGGNNYFGDEVVKKLEEFSKIPGELEKYILQRKIKSEIQDNVFIANYRYFEVKECTSEFSTFGSFAYKKDNLRFNVNGGNLIRLKRAQQNEGGIAIDKAVIAGLCINKDQQSAK